MRSTSWRLTGAAVCLLGLAGIVAAQQPKQTAAPGEAGRAKNPASPVGKAAAEERGAEPTASPEEREAAALQFAAEHHPELASLLEQLKSSNPKGYRTALQELSTQSERLTRLKTRMPERYEGELAIWRLNSRIRLLTARSAMSDSDSHREELRRLILERNDLRLALAREDRERQAARLEKLDVTIRQMEENREQAADSELERLLNTARNRVKTVRPRPSKEAVSPAGESKPKTSKPAVEKPKSK